MKGTALQAWFILWQIEKKVDTSEAIKEEKNIEFPLMQLQE